MRRSYPAHASAANIVVADANHMAGAVERETRGELLRGTLARLLGEAG